MEQELDLKSYFDVLKRRYIYLIAPAVVVLIGAAVYAYSLPPVYQARATILVESQQIPTDLARPIVTAGAIERVNLIEQRLTTRENLLSIIERFDLYPEDRLNSSPTDLVGRMRGDVSISQINVGRRRQATTIGFTIAFEYGDPGTATRVANEFVKLLLERNIQVRQSQVAETSRFFEQLIARLDTELVEMENRIVEYKRNNRDALPGSLPYLQERLDRIETEANDLKGRITQVQAQIDDPNGLGLDDAARAKQLQDLQAQLVRLRATYTDSHPEIRRVNALIAALEEDADRAAAAPQDPEATARRIDLLKEQLASLQEAYAAMLKQADTVRESMERAPQVEIELAGMDRGYDDLKRQYRDAQIKASTVQTGEQLEEDQRGEHFEVIEPAAASSNPTKPNRERIIVAGSFGGIALGAALVVLLELLDKSIRSAADLERQLQIRALATIPYVQTTYEQRARRRRVGAMVFGAVTVVIIGLVTVQAFVPLDHVAERLLQRVL